MVYIYKFTNQINGKIYIGSTKNVKRRLQEHREGVKKRIHQYLYRAINKYSWDSFKFEVIEECCPLLRNDYENKWIRFYNSLDKNFGYNMCLSDNTCFTEEVIKKMSERMKGNTYKLGKLESSETKERKSKSQMGSKDTDAVKKRKSEAAKKIIKTKEHCENISKGKLGKKIKPRSEEFKEMMRKRMSGVPKTEEHKENLSTSKKKYYETHKVSKETGDKISKALSGYQHSEESLRNMKIGRDAYWASRRAEKLKLENDNEY